MTNKKLPMMPNTAPGILRLGSPASRPSIQEEFKKPDWGYWGKMKLIPLPAAVWLACDNEPLDRCPYDETNYWTNPKNTEIYYGEMLKLFQIVWSHVDNHENLRIYPYAGNGFSGTQPCVDLAEFGKWATDIGYKLPKEFPTAGFRLSTHNDGDISIDFPYECELIKAISEIMYKHYSNLKEDEKPNQKAAALELDEKMNWPNQKKNEKASRTALSIVAKLQPAKFHKKT